MAPASTISKLSSTRASLLAIFLCLVSGLSAAAKHANTTAQTAPSDSTGAGTHIHSSHSSHSKVRSRLSVANEPASRSARKHGKFAKQVAHTASTTDSTLTVRDRHGVVHKVSRHTVQTAQTVLVAPTRMVKKRVAVIVRDRHGRKHTVFRTETTAVVDAGPHGHTGRSNEGRHVKPLDKEVPVEVVSTKKDTDDVEPKPAEPVPERLNPSFGKSYTLYDEGANARISGNYSSAIANLGRALALVPPNSRGGASVLQLNMEYELAQAAEGQGDFPLAARYYQRTLADRPNFTEAAVRLATVQARDGNFVEALKTARAAVQRSPNDPRTHAILAVVLEKMGSVEEAGTEKKKTRSLLGNINSIDTAPLAAPNVVAPPVVPVETGAPVPTMPAESKEQSE